MIFWVWKKQQNPKQNELVFHINTKLPLILNPIQTPTTTPLRPTTWFAQFTRPCWISTIRRRLNCCLAICRGELQQFMALNRWSCKSHDSAWFIDFMGCAKAGQNPLNKLYFKKMGHDGACKKKKPPTFGKAEGMIWEYNSIPGKQQEKSI